MVVGGNEADYYKMVEEFSFLSIDEMVTNILADKELKETPTGERNQTPLPLE